MLTKRRHPNISPQAQVAMNMRRHFKAKLARKKGRGGKIYYAGFVQPNQWNAFLKEVTREFERKGRIGAFSKGTVNFGTLEDGSEVHVVVWDNKRISIHDDTINEDIF